MSRARAALVIGSLALAGLGGLALGFGSADARRTDNKWAGKWALQVLDPAYYPARILGCAATGVFQQAGSTLTGTITYNPSGPNGGCGGVAITLRGTISGATARGTWTNSASGAGFSVGKFVLTLTVRDGEARISGDLTATDCDPEDSIDPDKNPCNAPVGGMKLVAGGASTAPKTTTTTGTRTTTTTPSTRDPIVGLWKSASGVVVRWVAISGGYQLHLMTASKLDNGCQITAGDAFRQYLWNGIKGSKTYIPLSRLWTPGAAGGACTTRWGEREAPVRIARVGNTLTVSCPDTPTKVCKTYTRIGG